MKEITPEEAKAIYERLPRETRRLLFSVEVAGKLEGVAHKHHLDSGRTSQMAERTGLLIMGVINQHDFINELQEAVRLTPEKAHAISRTWKI